ncbi:site-specific integrase [Gaetbulibacter sp. M235]|uniref:tyrosine-type recombinase/integrase n=1 Tax=Gaetbulibacter sp. M235 TaxID=3126510 RepID=UPI00374F6732
MSNLKKFITFEYESAYKTAYDLSIKRNYSEPKIYNAGGDLKQRWYVYFSFFDPQKGRMKRVTPFYGKANRFKTKEERLSVLVIYRRILLKLLRQGYNPFEDNTALYLRLNQKENEKVPVTKTIKAEEPKTVPEPEEAPGMALKEAFDYGLKLKKKLVSHRTLQDYQYKVNSLLKWLASEHPKIKTIQAVSKKVLMDFLNSVLTSSSPRYRNNFRADLSSILQVLEDNEVIEHNHMKKIPVLRAIPQMHKKYTDIQQEEIFSYLEEKDPILLLFIKFISYNFLRPKEVCRLNIGDININEQTVVFKAKNKTLKTKRIPSILLDELPDLSQMDSKLPLFSKNKIGGTWDASSDSKRNHFTHRFKIVVKDHFGLDKNYSLYSFRHTFITKLYRSLLKGSSPFEAKSELMEITGHATMIALESYLRDIDAYIPGDYSNDIRNKKKNG